MIRVPRGPPIRHDRPVTAPSAPLVELAHAYGVATDYYDWKGRHVLVEDGAVHDVLHAMGVDTSDPTAALHRHWEEPWRRMLPACVVSTQGDGRWFWTHVPDGDPVEVWVDLEQGGSRTTCRRCRTGSLRARSTDARSARPPSRCPGTCPWATTRSGPVPATPRPALP